MANGFQWAVRQGGATIGSYVVIQGPGQQGLACTFAARQAGAARIVVTGLARDRYRLELAKAWGADRVVVVDDEDIVEVVDEETSGELADVVVDVSGSPQAVLTSVDCLRPQGTLVLAGLSGSTTTTPMLLDRIVEGAADPGRLHRRQRCRRGHTAPGRVDGLPRPGHGQPHVPAGGDRPLHRSDRGPPRTTPTKAVIKP